MQTATPQSSRTGTMTIESPVDDPTYNILMALASKLEAIDTYKKYANDGKNGKLWRQLAQDDRRHADRLLEELRSSLGR
jgi:rubrerythrin